MNQPFNNIAYGFSGGPLLPQAPIPILAKRVPTANDTGYLLGTLWIYAAGNAAYVLTSVVGSVATWNLLQIGGGAGVFTTLTSSGATTLATTGASVNTFGNTTGATSVGILVGTGNFTLTGAAGSTVTIGTGITTGAISLGAAQTTGTLNLGGTGSSTGTITLGGGTGAQTIAIGSAGTGAKTITVGATGSADGITIGSTTAGSTIQLNLPANTNVVSSSGFTATAAGFTATAGNITASNGNIVLSTAASVLQLPGPVNIMTGAGVPSNGLAVNVGDMYINTTASTTTTRLYICSAASTWVTFTTSA